MLLAARWQGRSHLGKHRGSGLGKGGIAHETDFGKAQHKGFNLDAVKRLGRQGAVINQGIALPAFTCDLGATGPQAFYVPINRADGDLGFPRKLLARRRRWKCAQYLEQAQQAFGTGHSVTVKNWQEGSIE